MVIKSKSSANPLYQDNPVSSPVRKIYATLRARAKTRFDASSQNSVLLLPPRICSFALRRRVSEGRWRGNQKYLPADWCPLLDSATAAFGHLVNYGVKISEANLLEKSVKTGQRWW